MEFRVLGPLEVVADGEPLALGPPQQRAVLALLAMHANHVVSTDRLIDSIWGGTPPASAKQALRLYISKLRRLLEPAHDGSPMVLVTRRPGYVLEIDPEQLDVERFERAVADARSSDDAVHQEQMLDAALQLWRGPPYADFTYEDWASNEIHRLDELRLEAIELHVRVELELGSNAVVIGRLQELTAEHPLRESLRASHMLALYRVGRQAEALRVFQDLRSVLADELGIEPTEELRRLEDQMLLHDPALDASTGPGAILHNLPTSTASFVGRHAELDELTDLVRQQRIVTVTGPPGIGKTRLAVEAASHLTEHFADGVWLVELAQLSDPALVERSVASVLEVRGQAGGAVTDRLAEYLRQRRMLIVLDNCEHLLDAVADFVAAVIPTATGVHLLLTSREIVRIAGEFNYPLAPMPFPDPESELELEDALSFSAVELFRQRAAAAHPAFRIDSGSIEPVVRCCVRLDGLPLAIELAAARTRTLPINEIVDGLDHRFRLLPRGERGALPHHRTLEEAVGWSYDLASPQEQKLFELTSVFVGGFDAEAVMALATGSDADERAVIETLSALVDKSMVSTETLGNGGLRYGMLETLRAYGQDRLDATGNGADARLRHARYFLSLARTADEKLEGPEQIEWSKRLAAEEDNLRAALGWSLRSGSTEIGLELAGRLGRFWNLHGDWMEGRVWLGRLLQAGVDVPPLVLGMAHHSAGTLAMQQDDFDEAGELLRAGLDLYRRAGDINRTADALNNLAGLAIDRGELTEARDLYEEALRTKEEAGTSDRSMLINLGWLALETGDSKGARAKFGAALARSGEDGGVDAIAWSWLGLGVVAWIEGDLAEAGRSFDESVALWHQLDAKPSLVYGLVGQALVGRDRGDIGVATASAEQALDLALGLGGGERYVFSLGMVALLLAADGKAAEATRLGAALHALAADHGWPIWSWFRSDLEASLGKAGSNLDPQLLEEIRQQGEQMPIGDAVRYAKEALATVSKTRPAAAAADDS